MRRRAFTSGALALATVPFAARAQQTRVYRLAILSASPPDSPNSFWPPVELGLRDRGYVAGRNIAVEHFVGRTTAEFPTLAAKVVASRPDVIVTFATPATLAAKAATSTIPIVFFVGGSPTELGFVQSIARPRGNLTGVTTANPELGGKWLGVLKETMPILTRVALFYNPADPASTGSLNAFPLAAERFGIVIVPIGARPDNDVAALFALARANRAQAIYVASNSYFGGFASRIVDLAASYQMPLVGQTRLWVDAGALFSFGVNFNAFYRYATYYIDKILKGAKPADLPVEFPNKYEMILNMKTARALGLEIPLLVEAQADEVIE